jgi:hypothetical protein
MRLQLRARNQVPCELLPRRAALALDHADVDAALAVGGERACHHSAPRACRCAGSAGAPPPGARGRATLREMDSNASRPSEDRGYFQPATVEPRSAACGQQLSLLLQERNGSPALKVVLVDGRNRSPYRQSIPKAARLKAPRGLLVTRRRWQKDLSPRAKCRERDEGGGFQNSVEGLQPRPAPRALSEHSGSNQLTFVALVFERGGRNSLRSTGQGLPRVERAKGTA